MPPILEENPKSLKMMEIPIIIIVDIIYVIERL